MSFSEVNIVVVTKPQEFRYYKRLSQTLSCICTTVGTSQNNVITDKQEGLQGGIYQDICTSSVFGDRE